MSADGLLPRRMFGLGLLMLLAQLAAASSGPPAPSASPTAADTSDVTAQRCFHVVLAGESLGRIAARYGTTRRVLVTTNGLARPEALAIGQRLEIPRCAPGARVSAMTSSSEAVRSVVSMRARPAHVASRTVRSPQAAPERPAFIWPVEGRVLSGFGRRGFVAWHRGVDIQAQAGQPIRAAAPGTVVFSGWQSSYGQVVKLAHADGFTTLYAHNTRNFVRAGQRVEAGAPIAAVGRTGRATTPHLHFEIQRDGQFQNPMKLLERREPAPLLARSG